MRNFGIDPRHEWPPEDDSPFVLEKSRPISDVEFGIWGFAIIIIGAIVWYLYGLVF